MATIIEHVSDPRLEEANAIIERLEALVAARHKPEESTFDAGLTLLTWACVIIGATVAIGMYLLAGRWVASVAVVLLAASSRLYPRHVTTRLALGLVIGALVALTS